MRRLLPMVLQNKIVMSKQRANIYIISIKRNNRNTIKRLNFINRAIYGSSINLCKCTNCNKNSKNKSKNFLHNTNFVFYIQKVCQSYFFLIITLLKQHLLFRNSKFFCLIHSLYSSSCCLSLSS